jgi:acetyl esterase
MAVHTERSPLSYEQPLAPPAPLTPRRRLEIAAARLVGALPASAKRLIAGRPVRRDGLELDLDTQVLIRLAERDLHSLPGRTPEEARADLREAVRPLEGAQIPVAAVREVTIAGAAGPLRARLFVPGEAQAAAERGAPGALIVYYHGGGWVAGDLNTHDQPCRLLARGSGASVLSVDYRLAPEHRFPAPVDDALAAFRDAVARAEELGVDPARIAVAGDSAGGHLAAVTAQQAATDGGPAPAFQLLIYPVTDLVERSQSRSTFGEGFILTAENMAWYEEQFTGPDADLSDPRVSPLRAHDVGAVAPGLVVTAGFDPLRDEGEAYAHRLREAGVRTLSRRHPGYVHGFIHALTLGAGPREAIAEMGGVLRATL